MRSPRGFTLVDTALALAVAAIGIAGAAWWWTVGSEDAEIRAEVPRAWQLASEYHIERYYKPVDQPFECVENALVLAWRVPTFGECVAAGGVPGHWITGTADVCEHLAEIGTDGSVELDEDEIWWLDYNPGRREGVVRHHPTGRTFDWQAPRPRSVHGRTVLEDMNAMHARLGELSTVSRDGRGAVIGRDLITCDQLPIPP